MLKVICTVLSTNRVGKSLQESNLSVSKRASILRMPVVRRRAKLTWFYELTSLACIPGKGGPFYLQQSDQRAASRQDPIFFFLEANLDAVGWGITWFKGSIEETRLDMCWSCWSWVVVRGVHDIIVSISVYVWKFLLQNVKMRKIKSHSHGQDEAFGVWL